MIKKYNNKVKESEDKRIENIKADFKVMEDELSKIDTNKNRILHLKIKKYEYEFKIMSKENTLSAKLTHNLISEFLKIFATIAGILLINSKLKPIFENKDIGTSIYMVLSATLITFIFYIVVKSIFQFFDTYYINRIEEDKTIIKLIDLRIDELEKENDICLNNL
ncbi:TPA: hypothetical protein ACG3RE_003233 [Clostridioides difficile]|nr:hypothetical protein [Clostridioides difficile]